MKRSSRRQFEVSDIAAFDDEALRTFLDPCDGGVDACELGLALQKMDSALQHRVERILPDHAAQPFHNGLSMRCDGGALARAQQHVLAVLYWPLVYWHEPDDYDALIHGEHIHPRLLDALDIEDRIVCDIGAGSGRFALRAAEVAAKVIAVDVTPQLLQRLQERARALGLANVETRRGRFNALPLETGSVDVAVACSSFTTSGPHGGARALAEAERIVRPGGDVVVIWPQSVDWLRARGFTYLAVLGDRSVHFDDVATAERLCRRYYSDAAADWVLEHRSSDVPFAVLGTRPPSDLCIKRID
jgi:ubiquinone/menaquinone biosynthesis C-methylase UbiE